ncbi:MAG: GNAT family N-acetyltransferase [Gammaproteobacteria bacterium]|nr:GNAT family N-acetyltransferase [Gammaproteobacteria bacterium]
MLELLNDPDFISSIGDRNVRTLAEAREHIADKYVEHYTRNGFGIYLVVRRRDGASIGMCGLVNRDTLDDVDIGYAMLPDFRRRGYTLEAARATLGHAFGALGLDRVVAVTWVGNDASSRLLEKLGMKYECTTRLTDDEDECRLFAAERGTHE